MKTVDASSAPWRARRGCTSSACCPRRARASCCGARSRRCASGATRRPDDDRRPDRAAADPRARRPVDRPAASHQPRCPICTFLLPSSTASLIGRAPCGGSRRPVALALRRGLARSSRCAGPAFRNSPTPKRRHACSTGRRRKRVKVLEKHAPDARWPAGSDDLNAYIEDASAADRACSINVHPGQGDARRSAGLHPALAGLSFDPRPERDALPRIDEGEAARRHRPRVHARSRSRASRTRASPAAGRARPRQADQRPDHRAGPAVRGTNIRDANVKVRFTVAELKGVPEDVWKDKPRDDAGKVLLGLDYPTYCRCCERAETPARASASGAPRQNEGGEANLKLLGEIAQLRREYAQLFGMKSFADFQLRRRMAENTATRGAFLDDVQAAVQATRGARRRRTARGQGAPSRQPLEATKLERWDVLVLHRARAARALQRRPGRLPPVFPAAEEPRLRHAGRRAACSASATRRVAGHALARGRAGLRRQRRDDRQAAGDALRRPVSARRQVQPRGGLAAAQRGDARPARAAGGARRQPGSQGPDADELETLLHELGHALHNNLSATRYASRAARTCSRISSRRPRRCWRTGSTTRRCSSCSPEVCPTCKPVPDEMIDKARAARDFGKGMQFARQHLYAALRPGAATAPTRPTRWRCGSRWKARRRSATSPGTHVPGRLRAHRGRLCGGYYGYLWSLVVALDLRTAFEDDRLDPVVGARYRRTVLAQGRQLPPRELVKEFLGRETNANAFFDDLAR